MRHIECEFMNVLTTAVILRQQSVHGQDDLDVFFWHMTGLANGVKERPFPAAFRSRAI
jgi:hypothetical protein